MADSGADNESDIGTTGTKKITEGFRFWFLQIISWLGYALYVVLFIPWAIAMHAVILGLAIALFPLCCHKRGRSFFLYTYAATVWIPGELVHWYHRRNRWRGKVWDHEMGKPTPIPLKQRHRLSEPLSKPSQVRPRNDASFLTKLPPEIRQAIYREYIVGDSSHVHIAIHRNPGSKTKKPSTRISGYPCKQLFGGLGVNECQCIETGKCKQYQPHSEFSLPLLQRPGCGRLSLMKTCRQVYTESIDMLYNQQTFCFHTLAQPPYFIRSVLPKRLSQIRKVQFCYNQSSYLRVGNTGTSLTKYKHRMQKCSFCNLNLFLDMVKKFMTGLRSIEVFLCLIGKAAVITPFLGDAWLVRLFELQVGENGLRDLKIKVFPNSSTNDEYVRKVNRLDELLQAKIKQGAETYRHRHAKSPPG